MRLCDIYSDSIVHRNLALPRGGGGHMKFRSGLAGVLVSICLLMLIAMSVSCEEWWYAELEPNDDFWEATAMPSNNKISGRISENGDLDNFYDIVYEGNTYTYTIQDMTNNLQLMLYRKVYNTEDSSWHAEVVGVAVDIESGAGNESLVYVPTETQEEVFVRVEASSDAPDAISSYWLVKTVE